MPEFREIAPESRKKLWGITAFLAIDAAAGLYISTVIDPASMWALPSIVFGLLCGFAGGALAAILVTTKVMPKDLRAERGRE